MQSDLCSDGRLNRDYYSDGRWYIATNNHTCDERLLDRRMVTVFANCCCTCPFLPLYLHMLWMQIAVTCLIDIVPVLIFGDVPVFHTKYHYVKGIRIRIHSRLFCDTDADSAAHQTSNVNDNIIVQYDKCNNTPVQSTNNIYNKL